MTTFLSTDCRRTRSEAGRLLRLLNGPAHDRAREALGRIRPAALRAGGLEAERRELLQAIASRLRTLAPEDDGCGREVCLGLLDHLAKPRFAGPAGPAGARRRS